jgi:hypothetical protein
MWIISKAMERTHAAFEYCKAHPFEMGSLVAYARRIRGDLPQDGDDEMKKIKEIIDHAQFPNQIPGSNYFESSGAQNMVEVFLMALTHRRLSSYRYANFREDVDWFMRDIMDLMKQDRLDHYM